MESNIFKKTEDYIDKLKEMYPHVLKSDLKRICKSGLRSFYFVNSYGADTLFKDSNGTWIYCGRLSPNSIYWSNYYKLKLIRRLRLLFIRKKKIWDGYYYFAINNKKYDEIFNSPKKKGRPPKKTSFGKIKMFKLQDELLLESCVTGYMFRVSTGIDYGFTHFDKDFKSNNYECLGPIKPQTFSDILISNRYYSSLHE